MNKKQNSHIKPLTESYEKRTFSKITASTTIPPRPAAPAPARPAKSLAKTRINKPK